MSSAPSTIPAESVAGGKKQPVRAAKERSNWPATVVLIVCTLSVLVPLYVTMSMAFKTTGQAVDGNAFSLPSPLTFDSFVQAWTLTNFPRGFAISVFVSVTAVAGEIILSALAAYAIVRNWDRKLFRWSFFYLLAAMFIPFPVVALPQIQLTGFVGLDNPLGVAILHIVFALAFNTMLFTAFLRSIPLELEESMRMDGAGTWQV
ncbi:carbohydrate ABC transporter permease, partial [Arthrobacter sp.]|uniref:carbohydrate ABC transporter permease n=1 Tax=Arthrobacter sp. TaxID=1667 RepID=UPI002811544D